MSYIENNSLIGSWRHFGETGPAYEVIALGPLTPDGTDRSVRIRLAETGEEVDYLLSKLIDDDVLADAAG